MKSISNRILFLFIIFIFLCLSFTLSLYAISISKPKNIVKSNDDRQSKTYFFGRIECWGEDASYKRTTLTIDIFCHNFSIKAPLSGYYDPDTHENHYKFFDKENTSSVNITGISCFGFIGQSSSLPFHISGFAILIICFYL